MNQFDDKNLSAEDNLVQEETIQSDYRDQEKWYSGLIPSKTNVVTSILVYLNIIIYCMMVFSGVNAFMPETSDILNWGGNFRFTTLDGELWRLFTCMFVHIGAIHLLMNMYALLFIGLILEPILGRWKFLSIYILTGIGASLVSIFWHDDVVSAGASGAIFGMYGLLLAMLSTGSHGLTNKAMLTNIGVFVGYNLLYGVKGDIDNAAHIGGLLTGALIGYALVMAQKSGQKAMAESITLGVVAIALAGLAFSTSSFISNDMPKYTALMDEFLKNQEKGLRYAGMQEANATDAELLVEIRDSSIFYWKMNASILNQASKLDLPDHMNEQTLKLQEYTELRIKSCEVMVAMYNVGIVSGYDEKLRNYYERIDVILAELNGEE